MTSIVLGQGRDGSDTCIDLPELLATRLLVQGNSGSGKSHLLRRLLEQTATLVQQIMIDPEGDFVTLAERYGHLVIDVEDQSEASLRAAGERVRAHRASVVLNLEQVEAEMQLRAAGAFLNGMFEAPRAHWYPALVVVDEAQLFAPVAGGDTSEEARRLSLGAMTNRMCRGRKRGLAGVIATQRLAKLAKNVAAEASNFLMGRTFLDIDMARAADLLGMERRAAESFRDLARGQFMALGPALSRRPKLLTIGPVETASHNTGPVLVPLEPVMAEDLRDIILEPVHEFSPRPRRETRPPPPDLLAQLDAYGATREAEEPVATADITEVDITQLWDMLLASHLKTARTTSRLPHYIRTSSCAPVFRACHATFWISDASSVSSPPSALVWIRQERKAKTGRKPKLLRQRFLKMFRASSCCWPAPRSIRKPARTMMHWPVPMAPILWVVPAVSSLILKKEKS